MGATRFPDDLVQTQHAWNATYDALAAPHRRDITALRRLLRLSVRAQRPRRRQPTGGEQGLQCGPAPPEPMLATPVTSKGAQVVGTRRPCWQLLFSHVHCRTSVPLAVPQFATSATLPLFSLTIRT
ncbi:hypothetical protein QF027_009809 [Streptomyces canus]|nr:hypothetical protein [Streptomyces canus]